MAPSNSRDTLLGMTMTNMGLRTAGCGTLYDWGDFDVLGSHLPERRWIRMDDLSSPMPSVFMRSL